jgi:hypothetical protein
MIYYLDKRQFHQLWDKHRSPELIEGRAPFRIQIWNTLYRSQTKLSYFELDDHVNKSGFWGVVEGDEKDINWFLLQL